MQPALKLSNPGPIIKTDDIKPKQIYHKAQLNQENLLRQQLLGSTPKTSKFILSKMFQGLQKLKIKPLRRNRRLE